MNQTCSAMALIVLCSLSLSTIQCMDTNMLTLETNGFVIHFTEKALEGFRECICNENYQTCTSTVDENMNIMEAFTAVNETIQVNSIATTRYFYCYNLSSTDEVKIICQSSEAQNIYSMNSHCFYYFTDATNCDYTCVGIVWDSYHSLDIIDNEKIKPGMCNSDRDSRKIVTSPLTTKISTEQYSTTVSNTATQGQNSTTTESTTAQEFNKSDSADTSNITTLVSPQNTRNNSNNDNKDIIFIAVGAGLGFMVIVTIIIIGLICWKRRTKTETNHPHQMGLAVLDFKASVQDNNVSENSQNYEEADLDKQPVAYNRLDQISNKKLEVKINNTLHGTENLPSTSKAPMPTNEPGATSEDHAYTTIDYTMMDIGKDKESSETVVNNTTESVTNDDGFDTSHYSGVDESGYSAVSLTCSDSQGTDSVTPAYDNVNNSHDYKYEEFAIPKPNYQNVYSRLGEQKRNISDPYNVHFDESKPEFTNTYSRLGEQPRTINDPYNVLLKPKQDPRLRTRAAIPAERHETQNNVFPSKDLMMSNSDTSENRQGQSVNVGLHENVPRSNYYSVPDGEDDSFSRHRHHQESHGNNEPEKRDGKCGNSKENKFDGPYHELELNGKPEKDYGESGEDARPDSINEAEERRNPGVNFESLEVMKSIEDVNAHYATVDKSMKRKDRPFTLAPDNLRKESDGDDTQHVMSAIQEITKRNGNVNSNEETKPNTDPMYAQVDTIKKLKDRAISLKLQNQTSEESDPEA